MIIFEAMRGGTCMLRVSDDDDDVSLCVIVAIHHVYKDAIKTFIMSIQRSYHSDVVSMHLCVCYILLTV